MKQRIKVVPDFKDRASAILRGVLVETQKHRLNIGVSVGMNADGVGSKTSVYKLLHEVTGDYSWYQNAAFDGLAMVLDDAVANLQCCLGVSQVLTVQSAADIQMIESFARGLSSACDQAGVHVMNGETAELSAVEGFHWDFVASTTRNRFKEFIPIKPGQVVVGFKESGLRSNGYSLAFAILQNAYLQMKGFGTVQNYLASQYCNLGECEYLLPHVRIPWYQEFLEEAKQLAQPSRIYYPLLRSAVGLPFSAIKFPFSGLVHVTGGGIPLKCSRFLRPHGLGMNLGSVFPDPEPMGRLLQLSEDHPLPDGTIVADECMAIQHWNCGMAYLVVIEDKECAQEFVNYAKLGGYEAAIVGSIISQPEIHFRDYVFYWD